MEPEPYKVVVEGFEQPYDSHEEAASVALSYEDRTGRTASVEPVEADPAPLKLKTLQTFCKVLFAYGDGATPERIVVAAPGPRRIASHLPDEGQLVYKEREVFEVKPGNVPTYRMGEATVPCYRVALREDPKGMIGPMFGGNYVLVDGFDYPLPLHDHYELPKGF